jgi:hypothetical protein
MSPPDAPCLLPALISPFPPYGASKSRLSPDSDCSAGPAERCVYDVGVGGTTRGAGGRVAKAAAATLTPAGWPPAPGPRPPGLGEPCLFSHDGGGRRQAPVRCDERSARRFRTDHGPPVVIRRFHRRFDTDRSGGERARIGGVRLAHVDVEERWEQIPPPGLPHHQQRVADANLSRPLRVHVTRCAEYPAQELHLPSDIAHSMT